MSDMGDMWREVKKRQQEKRWNRLETADDTGWSKHSIYHWYRMVNGEKLDYWPSTGRCRYKGRNRNINSKFVKELLK